MIEPIMFLGLGFLAASLLALILLPLVHARAVRLTRRRIEALAPLSVAELKADKDVTDRLSPSELDAMFDLGYHFKHVDTIFERVFGRA